MNQNCLSLILHYHHVWLYICTLCWRFTVWDLAAESQYLVNLSLSVCFETSGACLTDVQIFSRRRLPKAVCDYNASPAIPSRWSEPLLEISVNKIKEQKRKIINVCLGCCVCQSLLKNLHCKHLLDMTCSNFCCCRFFSEPVEAIKGNNFCHSVSV